MASRRPRQLVFLLRDLQLEYRGAHTMQGNPARPIHCQKGGVGAEGRLTSYAPPVLRRHRMHESSTFSAVATKFHIRQEISLLGLSLFIASLGYGPLLPGPASETVMKKPDSIASLTALLLLQFPVAFALSRLYG